MRETLRTTIAQFSTSGGRAQARAVNVRAVEPAPGLPGAERGYLYILLQVTGSGGGHAALYREVLRAAQTAFYEAGGSLTSALNRAVRSAHLVLTRANAALPEANWRAGMSLAVLQGDQLTIAEVGPALVLVSHPKTIDQFPGDAGPGGTPLGGPGQIDIELFSTEVEPGSMLLMAQSDWLEQVVPEALAVAAAADNVSLAFDYLTQLVGDSDLSALLVGFGERVMIETPEPARVESAPVASPPPAPWPEPEPAPTSEAVFADDAVEVDAWSDPWVPDYAEEALPTAFDVQDGTRGAEFEDEDFLDETATPRSSRSLWPLILALIVIPVMIGALVAGMLWMRSQQADDRIQEILTGAETAIVDAEGLVDTDEEQARQRLQGATDFLQEARTLRPEDQTLSGLQVRYDDLLARLDHVLPLYGLVPMWDLKEDGHSPARVAVGGDDLFVLDDGRDEVYHFRLSELRESVTPAPEPVALRKGQQVGDLVISDLVDITWVEAAGNQNSRILALDTAGGLVSFDLTWGADRTPIVGREQWGMAELIRSYVGNLYIVDTKANQIWRYRPTDNGYEDDPEPYFVAGMVVDLSGVQSIAIDGSIWLLFADGRLLKFFLGEQEPFALRGLPDDLSTPTAVVVPVDGDRFYIADAGNGRIVEFTKDGQFTRQFWPDDGDTLRGTRDIFQDPGSGALYLLTADKLYKVDIPEPVEPSTASASD